MLHDDAWQDRDATTRQTAVAYIHILSRQAVSCLTARVAQTVASLGRGRASCRSKIVGESPGLTGTVCSGPLNIEARQLLRDSCVSVATPSRRPRCYCCATIIYSVLHFNRFWRAWQCLYLYGR